MILVKLCTFCILFSIAAGNNQLQPGLIQEFYNVFNNLSNMASMPHLMENPDCRRDCEIYRQALYQNQLWAAQMFDANGRLSVGIFKGNMHQMGSMEQCVSSSSNTLNIEGKFCFIQIYLKPVTNNILMNEIWKNAFNLFAITSKPYERNISPASNTILSTLCVPSSCTARDLIIASRKVLSTLNQTTFGFDVHVDDLVERNCAVKRELYADNWLVNYSKIFIFVMFVLVSAATFLDIFTLQHVQNNRNLMVVVLKSFSLQQNYKTLTSVKNHNDSIGCLSGLRCFTYFMLFVLHYCVKFTLITVDRTDGFVPFIQNPFISTLTKNATISLDLLTFLSGISQSYKISKFLKQNETKSILKSMLYKYLRFLTFWVIFFEIQSLTFNKTKFNLLYTPEENKINIWSILLCFENLYGLKNMYFAPTHSFYTNIQLYFICCIILITTKRCNNKMKLLFSIAFGSLICRSLFLYFYSNVQAFVTFGMSLNEALDMMSFMFAMPFSRLPFFVSGIALGCYMRENQNPNVIMSSLDRKIRWMVALLCLCIAILCYYPMDSRYKYNSFDGAVISFINSFCWLIFLIWMVWYCEIIAISSDVKRFLAADIFVILNRLTPYFSALHLFVLYKCLVDTRLLFEFKLSEVLGLDYLLLTVLVCAFVMLFIHLPLKNMWDHFITKKSDFNTETVRQKKE